MSDTPENVTIGNAQITLTVETRKFGASIAEIKPIDDREFERVRAYIIDRVNRWSNASLANTFSTGAAYDAARVLAQVEAEAIRRAQYEQLITSLREALAGISASMVEWYAAIQTFKDQWAHIENESVSPNRADRRAAKHTKRLKPRDQQWKRRNRRRH